MIIINENGSTTIFAILVMTIILISALFLIYTSNIEYLIVNYSHNNIQAYYMAEGKIYTTLKKEEYYIQQLMPRIETYIKTGRLGKKYDNKIILDTKDLFEGDDNNVVYIDFTEDDNRRILEMKTSSTNSGITQRIVARMTMINDIFEMRIPIVSLEHIEQDKIKEFLDYMFCLKEDIKLPDLSNDLFEIEAMDYEIIRIRQGLGRITNVEFFRHNLEQPVKKSSFYDEGIFLIVRNGFVYPTLFIESQDVSDKISLNGVLYIEGDLTIVNDFEFQGIIILHINPSSEVKIEGVVLLNDCSIMPLEKENIQINYNFDEIRKYGVHLPKFIDLKIQLMKSY